MPRSTILLSPRSERRVPPIGSTRRTQMKRCPAIGSANVMLGLLGWSVQPRLAQSEITLTHYLQDLFTILRDSISRSPCSELCFFTPADDAASLASSFILCMVTFETVPLAVTVWPTWSARTTLSLFTSHV